MLTQHYHRVNRRAILCITTSRTKEGFVSSGGELQRIQSGMCSGAAKRKGCIYSSTYHTTNTHLMSEKWSDYADLSVKDQYISLEVVFCLMIWTQTLQDKQNSNPDDDKRCEKR